MRKIKSSPIEREILWTLEEAGAENLLVLEATVKSVIKEISNEAFCQSLDNLIKKEFIEFEEEHNNNSVSVILTNKGKISLSV